MKTNAKQIESIANLVKPFDAIQQTYFLGVELIGFNTASDKIIDLQNQIEATKTEKGARKKAIDAMLKDMIKNNVLMGKSKCPIRAELRRVLDTSNLATGTKNNILTAVAFALEHKKPYDIKGPDKYNAALKAEKEKEKLKSEILKGATTPTATTPTATTPSATTPSATTPSATTPSATTPSATTPSATTPSATTPSATTTATKKNTRLNYCKDAVTVVRQLFDATQAKRYADDVSDSDIMHYNIILDSIDTIMDTLVLLSKQDRKVSDDMDDMDDMGDDYDDDLGIDSELVD